MGHISSCSCRSLEGDSRYGPSLDELATGKRDVGKRNGGKGDLAKRNLSRRAGKHGLSKSGAGKPDSDALSDMEDDAELWARIARTAAPLRTRNRVTHVATPPKPPRPKADRRGAESRSPAAKAVFSSVVTACAETAAAGAERRRARPADGAEARQGPAPRRGAARSSRASPARRPCGVAEIHQMGAREGLPPRAGHHRQGIASRRGPKLL